MLIKKAFTLLEIMVVLLLIGIVAGLAIKNLVGAGEKGKIKATKVSIEEVASALSLYKLDENNYPSTDEGLNVLLEKDYIKKIPKDAWGRELLYQAPGSKNPAFDIWSKGADGEDGGEKENKDIYYGEDDSDSP